MSTTIAFLGSGRIAQALIQGLLKTKSVAHHEIFVTSHSGVSSKRLAQEFGVTAVTSNTPLAELAAGDAGQGATAHRRGVYKEILDETSTGTTTQCASEVELYKRSNDEAIEAASMIILCTKPAQALATITASQKSLSNKLLISMAAGIRSEDLFQAADGKARILRAMPNTAVRVGKGTIALSPHASTTLEDLLLVKKVFSACAAIEKVSEEKMDAVTAMSGSSPAFALLFLEALIEAGTVAGLDPKIARSLAAHTLEGAAALVLQTEQSPQELRAEITSPNGTTAAGLRILEEAGFKKIIEQAVEAARNRAQELAAIK